MNNVNQPQPEKSNDVILGQMKSKLRRLLQIDGDSTDEQNPQLSQSSPARQVTTPGTARAISKATLGTATKKKVSMAIDI